MRERVLRGFMAGSMLIAAPHAWAGHPQERHGFWIGFGGGYGSAAANCDGCNGGDREGSGTFFLKLGGTLSPRLLLGFEANGWLKDQEGLTLTLGSGTLTATFYPRASSGFFVKAGVGASIVETELRFESFTSTVARSGFGVLAGAGYDLRVRRNISLTPCVNFHYGQPGDLAFEVTTLRGWNQNVVSLELGITVH